MPNTTLLEAIADNESIETIISLVATAHELPELLYVNDGPLPDATSGPTPGRVSIDNHSALSLAVMRGESQRVEILIKAIKKNLDADKIKELIDHCQMRMKDADVERKKVSNSVPFEPLLEAVAKGITIKFNTTLCGLATDGRYIVSEDSRVLLEKFRNKVATSPYPPHQLLQKASIALKRASDALDTEDRITQPIVNKADPHSEPFALSFLMIKERYQTLVMGCLQKQLPPEHAAEFCAGPNKEHLKARTGKSYYAEELGKMYHLGRDGLQSHPRLPKLIADDILNKLDKIHVSAYNKFNKFADGHIKLQKASQATHSDYQGPCLSQLDPGDPATEAASSYTPGTIGSLGPDFFADITAPLPTLGVFPTSPPPLLSQLYQSHPAAQLPSTTVVPPVEAAEVETTTGGGSATGGGSYRSTIFCAQAAHTSRATEKPSRLDKGGPAPKGD